MWIFCPSLQRPSQQLGSLQRPHIHVLLLHLPEWIFSPIIKGGWRPLPMATVLLQDERGFPGDNLHI